MHDQFVFEQRDFESPQWLESLFWLISISAETKFGLVEYLCWLEQANTFPEHPIKIKIK
jgi:hypothetical protein